MTPGKECGVCKTPVAPGLMLCAACGIIHKQCFSGMQKLETEIFGPDDAGEYKLYISYGNVKIFLKENSNNRKQLLVDFEKYLDEDFSRALPPKNSVHSPLDYIAHAYAEFLKTGEQEKKSSASV
jgi:hypothetical protein